MEAEAVMVLKASAVLAVGITMEGQVLRARTGLAMHLAGAAGEPIITLPPVTPAGPAPAAS